jgi:hypothetical protein
MQDAEHRRKFKRHPVRWKAAVVFNSADGKPILHTQTLDLSAGGAAIHSDYADLTGSVVTLLLAQPVSQDGQAPKMLKMKAQVVSSVHSPAASGFRHGLSFVPSKDDDLGAFAKLLATVGVMPAAAEPALAAPAAAPAAPETPAAPTGGGLLAQLKRAAEAKLAQEKQPVQRDEINARVSAALERAYRYLKNLTEQLIAVKPPYAKEYSLVGMPKLDGLRWEDCRIDFRTREISATKRLFEYVTLNYRLSSGKELRVTRESPADAKLSQLLFDTGVAFTTEEERNQRGSVVKTTFVVPCAVKASLQLLGNFETGKLLLKVRNVEHFGVLEHVVAPESVTDESLDELAHFILGESRQLGPLLLKNA